MCVLQAVLGGSSLALPEPMRQPLLVELARSALALTKQEHRILRMVQKGMPNQEIAAKTGIKPTTVRNHLARIYQKLNVSTRLEAVARAVELGLLDYR